MTVPAADTGNRLLGPAPADLTTATVLCPDGVRRAVVTIRTPSTTLTVYLDRQAGVNWGSQIAATAAGIPALEAADARRARNGAPP